MIPSYDPEKLNKSVKLANQVANWTVGAMISYACERESSETVWNWTIAELGNYVYDKFVEELMEMSDHVLNRLLEQHKEGN